MKTGQKIIATSVISAVLAGSALPALSARGTGDAATAHYTIETLPNGNYSFCSQNTSSDGLQTSPCFWFRKDGDRVVGYYFYPYTESSICIEGKVNHNTVTGEAMEKVWGLPEPPQPKGVEVRNLSLKA
ncbi:hypothetical protein ACE1CD_34010 [Aerosakkonema sp. BLCC-F183]|uniref:hypothetical protein n=1 Tax=Aerosakkonema sp. BLCC-F183 TaxID=3342834 RepID=UPI0035B8EF9B